jgi:hypothetical protein
MDRIDPLAKRLVCLALVLAALTPFAGCVGMVANLISATTSGFVPPAFPGLSEKKVAVVCIATSDQFGPTSTSHELARRIHQVLRAKVPRIELVDQQEVEDWIDQHDWNSIDFQAIGQAVDADLVVAVDVHSMSLHEGKTMYKGRADVELVVYDMLQAGESVFSRPPSPIEYPQAGGVYTTEISERDFRRRFLDVMARQVARNFHAFEMNQDYARDAELLRIGQ